MDIEKIVAEKLKEIESTENVEIIHCAESGSRAWGFASPDSDYDVRFIYKRPREFYLRLEPTRDVIEWQLDETLDINGWDIQKALRLLQNSNPTLFEWNNSPIVYKTTDDWQRVRTLINGYFCSKAGLYHYLSTAKANYKNYLKGEEVRLKKYFYVIRPLLACRWILDNGTPPPVLFSELAASELDPDVRPAVDELVARKMSTPEIGTGKRIDVLNRYIERNIAETEDILAKSGDIRTHGDWQKLDELFIRLIG